MPNYYLCSIITNTLYFGHRPFTISHNHTNVFTLAGNRTACSGKLGVVGHPSICSGMLPYALGFRLRQ